MPGIIRPVRPPILMPTRGAGSLAPPYADQGGGGAWFPQKLGANLTLWTNDTSLTGSPISAIANIGTAGGSFTGVGGSRPTRTTINGLPAPLFDGVNNALTGGPAQNAIMSAGPYSMVAAFKPVALTATATTSGWNEPNVLQDAAAGNIYPIAVVTTGIRSGHFSSIDNQTAAINPTMNVLYVIVVTYDGTNISLTLNGTTQTVAAAAPAVGATALILGQSQSGLKVNFALPEMMFTNRLMTSAEIANARAYLVNKWGATP